MRELIVILVTLIHQAYQGSEIDVVAIPITPSKDINLFPLDFKKVF
ncbi:hypothetical protein [Paenibacillus sp. GCM10012306]